MKRPDEWEAILSLLPEKLPANVLGTVRGTAAEDLGKTEFLVYRRESWSPSFDLDIGWPEFQEEARPRWAANCLCGSCGSTWHSGWKNGSPLISAGPDGSTWTGIPEDEDAQLVCEGDTLTCPCCGTPVTAVTKASLRNGRTYQVLTARVENLGRYTAVVYWMLRRRVDAQGDSRYDALPWAAVAVGTDGRLYRFAHTKAAGFNGKRVYAEQWRPSPRMGEPICSRYYSWGCTSGTAVGGYLVTDIPDQTGQTGEKTGLADYIAGGGSFPMLYLLHQKRYKPLENLVRAGWTYTIDSAFDAERSANKTGGAFLRQIADLSKRKPREMLRMDRAQVARFGRMHWAWEKAALWMKGGFSDPEVFERLDGQYGTHTLAQMLEAFGTGQLPRLDAYLRGQARRNEIRSLRDGATAYLDYRRMLADAGGGDTPVELWPPHLRAAHDRLTRLSRDAKDRRLDPAFAALREKWRGLEWSDGTICAVLPGESAELVREGRVLCHCVGGYCEQHCEGKLIVFIRHARRPERSWFTLNIDTTGARWQEVQLHGYCNEYAHGKDLHIPAAVRDFVTRWEQEILTPVFSQVKRKETAQERGKQRCAGVPA